MQSLSIKIGILCLSLILSINPSQGQELGNNWLEMKDLDIQPHLPKYLLSRKSAVFISVPRSTKNPNLRADWRKLSLDVHKAFKKMKLDPVSYYYLDDVFGSSDANISFSKEMIKREIKYIVVVSQSVSNAGGVGNYRITITSFNKKASYISENQKAWQMEGPDLKVVLSDMRKDVIRAEMELGNYLIPDVPEFFTDTKVIAGKRIPTYAKDLKVDNLVIPKFTTYHAEDSTKLDAATRQKIATYNNEVSRKNRRLEEIMKTYPLKYEFSESSLDDDIYNQGHQFVLLRMHASGKTIKQMLNFDVVANETDYVTIKATEIGSTLQTLPVDAVVHKYYVKHVYTKDVYLGSRWDADVTWEESLQNFIFHMKDILKVKK